MDESYAKDNPGRDIPVVCIRVRLTPSNVSRNLMQTTRLDEGDVHGFKGERMLMRVYVEEQDKYRGRPLYVAVMELLQQRRFAGATAFQGTLGFGASSHIHTEHVLSFTTDLPIVIECIDTEQRINDIVPEVDTMIGGGLITLEQVRVILYRKSPTQEERGEDEMIDITGRWRVRRE